MCPAFSVFGPSWPEGLGQDSLIFRNIYVPMFLFYKRLFASIYVKQGVVIAPLDANFIFPIPDAEYEYSPNEK